MKYLFILALILISCNAEKLCQKHLDKARAGGCLKTDSVVRYKIKVIPAVTTKGESELTYDTVIIDSLRIKDSCYTPARIKQSYRAIKPKPADVTGKQASAHCDIVNGKHVLILSEHERKDTATESHTNIKADPKTVEVKYIPWTVWLAFGLHWALILGLVYIVLKSLRVR